MHSNHWMSRTAILGFKSPAFTRSRWPGIGGPVIAALLGLGALGGCSDKNSAQAEAAKAPPAVPVLVAQVVEKRMPLRLHAIGNVETIASVAVQARVDGQITKVHVRDGQDVAAGDLLFQLDPKPYRSQLDQARANLAQGQSQLEYLKGQERRYQDLLQQNFVSKEGYAQVAANFRGAEAGVKASEAAVEHARVNLEYTTIRAPISGRVGKVMLSEGNLVKAADSGAMLVINQLSPIYVSVAVPERYLNEIRERQKAAPLRIEAALDRTGQPLAGQLAFIDNAVDLSTGTIKLRGIFENRDKVLWPGQFVDAWVALRDEDDAIVVPTQALQTGPDGQYVFVVKDGSAAEMRKVEVARAEGAESVIAAGVRPGETVVVDGASRLLPGTRVSMKPAESAS